MPAATKVPWLTPSRRTVIRSAIPSTSGSRWLTYMMPTPRLLRPNTSAWSWSIFLRTERGRGLVQQEHLRLGEEGLDHLDQLSLRQRETSSKHAGRDVQLELVELGGRPLLHVPVGGLALRRHGEVEVLGHGHLQNLGVGLVGHAQTETDRFGYGARCEGTPADLDGAFVGREQTARDPEQRRLPGPVLPDERVDLARAAVHAHLAYGLHRAETLGDRMQRQHDGGLGFGAARHSRAAPYNRTGFGICHDITSYRSRSVFECSCLR